MNKPVLAAIPKYNSECQGYYMPDGSAVIPQANGTMLPRTDALPCPTIVPQLPPAADLAAIGDAVSGAAVVNAVPAAEGAVVPNVAPASAVPTPSPATAIPAATPVAPKPSALPGGTGLNPAPSAP